MREDELFAAHGVTVKRTPAEYRRAQAAATEQRLRRLAAADPPRVEPEPVDLPRPVIRLVS